MEFSSSLIEVLLLVKASLKNSKDIFKKYNRIGNAIDPLVVIDWQFIGREIPVHLREKPFKDTGWEN